MINFIFLFTLPDGEHVARGIAENFEVAKDHVINHIEASRNARVPNEVMRVTSIREVHPANLAREIAKEVKRINAANPHRIGAEQRYDVPNRILERPVGAMVDFSSPEAQSDVPGQEPQAVPRQEWRMAPQTTADTAAEPAPPRDPRAGEAFPPAVTTVNEWNRGNDAPPAPTPVTVTPPDQPGPLSAEATPPPAGGEVK